MIDGLLIGGEERRRRIMKVIGFIVSISSFVAYDLPHYYDIFPDSLFRDLLKKQIEEGQVFPQKTLNISLEADVSTNFDLPLSFKCQMILLGTAH